MDPPRRKKKQKVIAASRSGVPDPPPTTSNNDLNLNDNGLVSVGEEGNRDKRSVHGGASSSSTSSHHHMNTNNSGTSRSLTAMVNLLRQEKFDLAEEFRPYELMKRCRDFLSVLRNHLSDSQRAPRTRDMVGAIFGVSGTSVTRKLQMLEELKQEMLSSNGDLSNSKNRLVDRTRAPRNPLFERKRKLDKVRIRGAVQLLQKDNIYPTLLNIVSRARDMNSTSRALLPLERDLLDEDLVIYRGIKEDGTPEIRTYIFDINKSQVSKLIKEMGLKLPRRFPEKAIPLPREASILPTPPPSLSQL